MVSNAFILGKYDRRNFGVEDISKSAETWEGDGKNFLSVTHIHNDPNVFSNHTERDEEETSYVETLEDKGFSLALKK